MSARSGIARESLNRSATRIVCACGRGVRPPCAAAICVLRVVDLGAELRRLGALRRDHDEPAGDEQEDEPAADDACLRGGRQLAHVDAWLRTAGLNRELDDDPAGDRRLRALNELDALELRDHREAAEEACDALLRIRVTGQRCGGGRRRHGGRGRGAAEGLGRRRVCRSSSSSCPSAAAAVQPRQDPGATRRESRQPDVLRQHGRDLAQDPIPGDARLERRAERGNPLVTLKGELGVRLWLDDRRWRNRRELLLERLAASPGCRSPSSWPAGSRRRAGSRRGTGTRAPAACRR